MIIKSISIKGAKGSFKKLVNYILEDGKTPVLLSRFMKGEQSIESLASQFVLNENNRLHKRKGSVKLFHEVISFDKRDNDEVRDINKLKKLARIYAKKRAPQSPMLCSIHEEEDKHLHIHFLFGCRLDGRALRIEKQEFSSIKNEMEMEQNKLFDLKHSKINHSPSKKKFLRMLENTVSRNEDRQLIKKP